MAAPTPERKQRKVPLRERAKQLTAELFAAKAKGGIKRALEHLTGRIPEGQSKEEAGLEIRGEAMARARAAERKIDAIANPEKRFQTKVGSRLETHPRKTVCEDNIITDEASQLYAILDGMGGHGGGANASAMAKETVARLLTGQSTDLTETIQKMKEALAEANRVVQEDNATNLRDAGTTATVVKIVKEPTGKRTAVVGHVGDSRLYIRKKDGRLVQMTTDHNSLDRLVSSGSISEAERQILRTKFAEVVDIDTLDDSRQIYEFKNADGRVIQRNTERELYDGLNSISKAVGFGDTADVFTAELEDDDQLLLASDGLHDLVTDSRINEAFADGSNPDEVAGRLLADSKIPIRPGSGGKVDDDRGIIVVGREDVLAPVIDVVKVDYVNRALTGEPLPVPYDVVGQEGFVAAMTVNAKAIELAFKAYYGTHGFADSIEENAWRRMGAEVNAWIADLGTAPAAATPDAAAAAAPTLATLEAIPADPAEAERLLHDTLTLLRTNFLQRGESLPRITATVIEALNVLKKEAFGGDQSATFKIWLRNIARQDHPTADLLLAAGFDEVAGAKGTDREEYNADVIAIHPSLFDRHLLRAVTTNRLIADGQLPEGARFTLDYLDQENITGDNEVVRLLAKLMDKISALGDSEAFKALPEVTELAVRLGVPADGIYEVVVAQREALIQQAAQQEKAGRSWKAALAKAGGYLAAGIGGGMYVAAAAANPLFLTGGIFAAKAVDAVLTHTNRSKTRDRLQAEIFASLKTEQSAFVALDEAEQSFDKTSGVLRITLENIAAGLARKKDQVYTTWSNEHAVGNTVYQALLESYCRMEADDYTQATNRYHDAVVRGEPSDVQRALYIELLRAQAIFDQAAEPYSRAAKAQEAISRLELSAQYQEKDVTKYQAMERLSAVLGIKGELLTEKLSSVAFFAAAGAAAREWVPLRIALGAFAGARLGDAAASLFTRHIEKKREAQFQEWLLTEADLTKIDLTNTAIAFNQLQELQYNAGITRERVRDLKFAKEHPAEHRRLEQFLQTYEHLQAWVRAQRGLNDLGRTEDEAFEKIVDIKRKTTYLKTLLRSLSAVAGGMAGMLVGIELVELAASKAEAANEVPLPSSSTGEPVSGGEPAVPEVPSTAAADASSPSTVPVPETTSPDAPPAATSATTPEPTTGSAAAPTPTTEPTSTPSVKGTTEALSHKVGKGEGLSHALRGQDTMKTINAELRDTKVTINGHEVSLNETGVRNAGEVSAVLQDNGSGEKTIVLYDANDGHQITASEMDKYLYVLKDGLRSVSGDVVGHVDSSTTGTGEIPAGGFTPGEAGEDGAYIPAGDPSTATEFRLPAPDDTAASYIQSGLEAYVSKHPEWSYIPNNQLQNAPELSGVRAELNARYLEHLSKDVAERTPSGGAGIAYDRNAEEVSHSPIDGLVNPETHRLTEAGVRELGLNEHISASGEVQDYGSFKKEIMALLQADERNRITGPNGLIFENRGGILHVDVAGGAQEHFPLDEKLYQELMAEYKGHVETALDGRFDKQSFYDAMDRAGTHHELKTFEQADLTLNFLNEDKSFVGFKEEIQRVMTIHDTDKFRTANGLTFIKEGDQLFVRATISRYEVTPALYESLMLQYERLLRSPDFKGVFDGEQLAKAFENSK